MQEEHEKYEDTSATQAPQASQQSQTSTTYGVRTVNANKAADGALSSPVPHVSMNETSGHLYSFRGKKADSVYPRLAEEARARIVGPMPPTFFLDKFLARRRISDIGKPSCVGAFKEVPDGGTKESLIYKPLVRVLGYIEVEASSRHLLERRIEPQSVPWVLLPYYRRACGSDWSRRYSG